MQRALHAEVTEQRKFELLRAIADNPLEPVHNLPREEQEWLRERIKQRRILSPDAGYTTLLLLGDEEEIKRVMEPFPRYASGANSPHKVGQPRIIEYMAATMFIDEPAQFAVQGDVTAASPPSTSAALWILETLARSWEIPPEVRAWADEANGQILRKGLALNESVRGNMRTWWKENERAIKARDWASVKPGRRLALGNTPVEGPGPAAQRQASPEFPPPGTATVAGRTEPLSERASHFWVWMGVIGAVVLLLGATFIARPRGED